MSDEIKKVIDYLNIKGYKMVGVKQKKILLDYITNLQQENDRLNEENKKFNKWIETLNKENHRLNNIIKDIKSQLDYLETYSSKEDVFNDMKRRLDRIENIIKENNNEI